MRIGLIVMLLIGLAGCQQTAAEMTDEEILFAACMDDSHMSKQSLKLFGPINKEWCQCQLNVLKTTLPSETHKEVATLIRNGDAKHVMNAANFSRQLDDELTSAMKVWIPTCKPFR